MWQCSIQASRQTLDLVSESITDFFVTTALFEVDEKNNIWLFEGLFDNPDQRPEILSRMSLLTQALSLSLSEVSFQELPEKDWLAENRASFPPIEVGRFYIHSSYEKGTAPIHKTVLEIDASLAFGTGSHQTTRGCLLALEALFQQNYSFKSALDLGTGSAILAMALADLFQCPTLATDIDPDALAVAQENVSKNNYSDRVSCIVSDGFNHNCFQKQSPFDLIVANILAGPLIDLSTDIIRHLEEKGVIVLSGLLTTQADDVTHAYTTQGMQLLEQKTFDEWSVLIMQKI